MPNRYTVNVVSQISGSVEVEADTEDEALDKAAAMHFDEWDEVVIDSTDTPNGAEFLNTICDECGEDDVNCECEICPECGENEVDCVCEVCTGCGEFIDECNCEDDEDNEDE